MAWIKAVSVWESVYMESLELVGNRCIFSKATVLGYAAEEGGENLNQSAVLWMLSWEVERFLSLSLWEDGQG